MAIQEAVPLATALAQVKTPPASVATREAPTTPTDQLRAWPASVGPSDWQKVAPSLQEALLSACRRQAWPIYMFGEVGRGKSCAAACLYRDFPGWALWFETAQIVADVLECRSNGKGFIVRSNGEHSWDEWESSILRKVRDAHFVCFDDVGIRKPSEAAYEVFFNLANLRRGKPTVFTGNLDGRSLRNVYDDRICSRLLCGTVIEVTGADRRLDTSRFVRA